VKRQFSYPIPTRNAKDSNLKVIRDQDFWGPFDQKKLRPYKPNRYLLI
jgi:hypothetical protein